MNNFILFVVGAWSLFGTIGFFQSNQLQELKVSVILCCGPIVWVVVGLKLISSVLKMIWEMRD